MPAIKPSEVKRTDIPEVVYEVFNELISENFGYSIAIVHQNDVVQRLLKNGLSRKEIYDKRWLDVERVYRDAGWKVRYNNPELGEDEAHFEFTC